VAGELGCDDHVLATLAKDAPEKFLRSARTIGIGGVEQGDAQIEGTVHHFAGRFEIGPSAEVVATQAEQGYLQPGPAEIALLHEECLSQETGSISIAPSAHFAAACSIAADRDRRGLKPGRVSSI